MRRKQLLILAGMLAAVAVCGIVGWLSIGRGPLLDPGRMGRLTLVARWLAVPGLCLLAGIGVAAGRRFLSPETIDGGPPESKFDVINLRYNLNTLEQTVLATLAWLGVALEVRPENLAIIPSMAMLFAAGRATFWVGYLTAPWARAFGLGLTFYPTAAALVWLLIRRGL